NRRLAVVVDVDVDLKVPLVIQGAVAGARKTFLEIGGRPARRTRDLVRKRQTEIRRLGPAAAERRNDEQGGERHDRDAMQTYRRRHTAQPHARTAGRPIAMLRVHRLEELAVAL